MTTETALIPLDNINPVQVFCEGGVDELLARIETIVMEEVFDITTARGRKDCASMAYKVARSRTTLDEIGKNLVADWKEKSKKVDTVRKQARDFLEDLQAKVRQPLTEFEASEEARIAAEKAQQEYEASWDEAIAEDDLFNRQKAIEAKEREFARIEAEQKARAEAERLERERIEREERIRKEAEEMAKRDAEEAIAKAEREKQSAEDKAKRDAEAAEQRRIADEVKAKADQEAAVKRAQEDERRRIEEEQRKKDEEVARIKAEAEKLSANKKHQAKINNEALACLVGNGFTDVQGRSIIELVAKGMIKHVYIKY